MTFDVTDAPNVSHLVSVWWGTGFGKIEPFISGRNSVDGEIQANLCWFG